MNPGELACYLYCLTSGVGGEAAAASGVDERHPVLVLDCGGIGAIYSEVELDEFVGPAAEARLQDLTWLGPRVCRHEAVIEQAMSRAAVLPARFATLFTSLESLEWAVKGLLDRSTALEGALRKLSQPAAEEDRSPGARYFEQKRIKAQAEREFNQRLKEHCRQTASALSAAAGGFRERKAMPPEGGAEAVLNWAFLLAPAEIAEFRAALERLQGDVVFPGLRLALTGPWPPFSFVPDLSDGARG